MKVRPKEYRYRVGVRWKSERKGVLKAEGKEPLDVATPPEFKGHPGVWTPEDLFVGALVTCFMTTFLGTAYHRGLKFEDFKADAEGVLARPEGEFLFTEVVIRAKLLLPPGGDKDLAREVLEFAEKDCLISHSIVTRVRMEPLIYTLKEPSVSAV